MMLQVSCSFVRAGLRAAGWGWEPLTAGLGLFSCSLLYFYREFLLCEIGDPREKKQGICILVMGISPAAPLFIRSFRSRMGVSRFYPEQLAGMVFSWKGLARKNDWHSGNRECLLLSCRHVPVYHKVKKQGHRCPCFFSQYCKSPAGNFHTQSHIVNSPACAK